MSITTRLVGWLMRIVASELGRYLDRTLRNGGADGAGASLPPLLIDDIKTWVLRHQVSGRAFLKGPESWT